MKLIVAIIGVVLAGGIFFWYTKPAYDGIQEARAKIAQYDEALNKAAELQKLKQTLLSRFNTFNPTDLDHLQKLLPDHVDNVRLILDLDALAGHYGIALQNVDVSSSEKQDTKSQKSIGSVGSSNQKYDSLTFNFTTTATYSDFVDFLTALESSLRIVDLVSLSIASGASASSGAADNSTNSAFATQATVTKKATTEPLYTYTITLRTYWLK